MTTHDQDASIDLAVRAWSPSSSAAQRMQQQTELGFSSIVDASKPEGVIRAVLSFFARPFVRIVIGLALFISAALVYDTTINHGAWTEKQEKAKATKHRGVSGPDKPKRTPDG